VDGNAERVLARVYGFAYNKGSAELKHKAYDALAQVMQLGAYPPGDINEAVMQLGQTLCTRSAPECGGCPLAPACLARKQGRQKQLPKSKPSTTKVDVLWYLYVLRKGGRVAVHPLNRLPLLSRQVGFPGRILYVSGKQAGIWHDSLPQPWGEMLYQRLCALEPSAQGRHAITHHRIQVKLFVGYAQELERSLGAELLSLQDLLWVNENEIENQLISSLMTKAWFKFFPFYA
jgi:A/G-specific adenine glycosylase